jgi:hypothetical protein
MVVALVAEAGEVTITTVTLPYLLFSSVFSVPSVPPCWVESFRP